MYNVAKIEVYVLLQNVRNFNLYVVFAKKICIAITNIKILQKEREFRIPNIYVITKRMKDVHKMKEYNIWILSAVSS